MKPKLTPWFPPEVLPVRDGVYEVDFYGPGWFQRFSKGRWFSGAGTAFDAARQKPYIQVLAPKRWRGLAEEPK